MIRVGSLDATGADITLLQAESSVSYASGHLLFARDDTLMAQPFDLDTRQLQGRAVSAGRARQPERQPLRGCVGLGERHAGIRPGRRGLAPQLTWFDRTGHALGTLGDPAPYSSLALSPDERRVAVALGTGNPENVDIWLIDIARNVRSRLTVDPGRDVSPVWSPDGTRIVFQSSRSGQPVAMRQTLSNGTGADELLLEGPGNFTMTPSGWSADGRFIAYTTRGSNVWVLPLFGDRKPFAVAANSVHRRIGRVLAGWPMDRIYEQRRRPAQRLRSAFSRGQARNLRCRETAAAIRCGERTAGNCSTLRRMGP